MTTDPSNNEQGPKITSRQREASTTKPETEPSSIIETSSSAKDSSWQFQLNAARTELARRVRSQQEQDGLNYVNTARNREEELETAILGEKVEIKGEEGVPGEVEVKRERRESIATEDGEEDSLIAEMLRPKSRSSSTAVDDSVMEDSKETRSDGGERTSKSKQTQDNADEKICRICFDSEEEDLGKLFRPCKCRGSSQYVHTECLTAWRKASTNSSNFYRCGTCSYEYRFQRTLLGNIINSKFSVLSITLISFLMLIWIAGFLANSLLSVVESRSNVWNGTPFDDFFVSDHILLGEGVRESLSFVTHQLEDSRWPTARKIAYQAQLQEQARLGVDVGFWGRVALHFTKGTALLGLLSVFYTYIAATFVSPLGRTLFRAIRPAGGRRRGADNSASFGQIIIIIVIVVGVARAIRQVYRGVRWITRRLLSRLEDLVLEVK
ncbi:hypothetical protein JCM5350_001860 [Sporobolomyces pararoseus]